MGELRSERVERIASLFVRMSFTRAANNFTSVFFFQFFFQFFFSS